MSRPQTHLSDFRSKYQNRYAEYSYLYELNHDID